MAEEDGGDKKRRHSGPGYWSETIPIEKHSLRMARSISHLQSITAGYASQDLSQQAFLPDLDLPVDALETTRRRISRPFLRSESARASMQWTDHTEMHAPCSPHSQPFFHVDGVWATDRTDHGTDLPKTPMLNTLNLEDSRPVVVFTPTTEQSLSRGINPLQTRPRSNTASSSDKESIHELADLPSTKVMRHRLSLMQGDPVLSNGNSLVASPAHLSPVKVEFEERLKKRSPSPAQERRDSQARASAANELEMLPEHGQESHADNELEEIELNLGVVESQHPSLTALTSSFLTSQSLIQDWAEHKAPSISIAEVHAPSMADYILGEQIGKGAYGSVHKAYQRTKEGQTSQPLVIKFILKTRILADCWKRHQVWGNIPMEVATLEHVRKTPFNVQKRPWAVDRSVTKRTHPSDIIESNFSNHIDKHIDGTVGGIERASNGDRSSKGIDTDMSMDSAHADTNIEQDSLESPSHTHGHPNIIRMLDFFQDATYWFLVMPTFGKHTIDLFDYIEARPKGLFASEARTIIGQIADALAFLHTHHIVHRDIKDENIILDELGHAKLIDFGSAAMLKPNKVFTSFSGTLDYAAPEILNSQTYRGPEQDVWAFGIVMFVVLCGECPFKVAEETQIGLTPDSRAQQILLARTAATDEPDPDGGAHLSDAQHLIASCLRLDPRDRLTAAQIFDHPFLQGHTSPKTSYA